LRWSEVQCYYLDSEEEKNYLSEDDDLKDALRYKADKKMKKLTCIIERRDGKDLGVKMIDESSIQ